MPNTPRVKQMPVGIGSEVVIQRDPTQPLAPTFGAAFPGFVVDIFQPSNKLALLGYANFHKSQLNEPVAVVYIPRIDALKIFNYKLLKHRTPRKSK